MVLARTLDAKRSRTHARVVGSSGAGSEHVESEAGSSAVGNFVNGRAVRQASPVP